MFPFRFGYAMLSRPTRRSVSYEKTPVVFVIYEKENSVRLLVRNRNEARHHSKRPPTFPYFP
jgi:hypothetical protein